MISPSTLQPTCLIERPPILGLVFDCYFSSISTTTWLPRNTQAFNLDRILFVSQCIHMVDCWCMNYTIEGLLPAEGT